MGRDWTVCPLEVYYQELASGLEAMASWSDVRPGDKDHLLECAKAFHKLSRMNKPE